MKPETLHEQQMREARNKTMSSLMLDNFKLRKALSKSLSLKKAIRLVKTDNSGMVKIRIDGKLHSFWTPDGEGYLLMTSANKLKNGDSLYLFFKKKGAESEAEKART